MLIIKASSKETRLCVNVFKLGEMKHDKFDMTKCIVQCLSWCRGLVKIRSSKDSLKTIKDGMVGLRMSVVLCSHRDSAFHFIMMGGLDLFAGSNFLFNFLYLNFIFRYF